MLNSNRDLFQKKKIIRFKTLLQNIWIAIVGIILGLPAGFYFTDYIFKYSIGVNYDFFAFYVPDRHWLHVRRHAADELDSWTEDQDDRYGDCTESE
ncbi:hypothetical protein [Ruminococcus sp.]|uniref:hypothetical protein n=1 Tax=Ruminococcus sp. TaxID=41978 RepID=UPI0025FE18E1|nr:hypothetical protein [Ruminococcus sp.]